MGQGLRNLVELSEAIRERELGIHNTFSSMLLGKDVDEYQKALESLNHNSGRFSLSKSKMSQLLWPISEERHGRGLKPLGRYHDTMHQTLQVDTV